VVRDQAVTGWNNWCRPEAIQDLPLPRLLSRAVESNAHALPRCRISRSALHRKTEAQGTIRRVFLMVFALSFR
jgi:hypothetical protein